MRKGLFLSRNFGRISESVDIDGLAAAYPDLAVTRVYDHLFGQTQQHDIIQHVEKEQLDGIVFAGPSPSQFDTDLEGESLIKALKRSGVNQNRIAFANLDAQIAMVHSDQRKDATSKARLLIDTALAKVEHCHDVASVSVVPNRAVLVVGGTLGGIVAARELLGRGYKTIVVETSAAWRTQFDAAGKIQEVISQIEGHAHFERFFDAQVTDMAGWCGEYTVQIIVDGQTKNIIVGGVLLCLGQDTDWIDELRPIMHLDTDDDGFLVGPAGAGAKGKTKDPGIWFVPFEASDDRKRIEPADARAAVASLTAALDRGSIEHPVLVSEVDETICGGCGTCVKTCAFSASGVDIDKKISVIDIKRCVGCGNCVTACPTGARNLVTFPTEYVNSAIDILSRGAAENGEPKVLAFLCKNSGYLATDAVADAAISIPGQKYSINIMPLRIECGGNIDTLYILRAFDRGFDGVALVVCKDRHCHYVVGNTDMERRLGLFRAVLRSRGIDDNRMRIIHSAANEGEALNEEFNIFSEELKKMERR
jgi:F420-non-reducing hydrogenase iron-sulfur subunit